MATEKNSTENSENQIITSNPGVITITAGGTDIRFKPDIQTYNRFINEISSDNKVTPAQNFLNRCVLPEDRELLRAVLKYPGANVKICNLVFEAYSGDLEITVKM